MTLDKQQLNDLDRDGFLMLPSLFSEQEVDLLRARLPNLLAGDHAANIIEKDSGEVRTAMALHLRDEVFARLVRHPRLLDIARQIRPGPLYIQQVKVNVKAAFSGEIWQWHYDFATHHRAGLFRHTGAQLAEQHVAVGSLYFLADSESGQQCVYQGRAARPQVSPRSERRVRSRRRLSCGAKCLIREMPQPRNRGWGIIYVLCNRYWISASINERV